MQDDQAQEPLSNEEERALKSWTNVGAPGPAPKEPVKPADIPRKLTPITQSRKIPLNWRFTQKDYSRLQLGHVSNAMEDKWDIYCQDKVVHFHRSWTGIEVFRLQTEKTDGIYISKYLEAEQNPEYVKPIKDTEIKNMLHEVLVSVLRVKPQMK